MNRYFEETILNSNPVELIRLLYQQAIASVEDAREHLRQKRIAERCAAIMQAYRIMAELIASLRPEAAPEMANQLRSLYCYIQQRLLDANMNQTDEALAEAFSLLTILQEAWSGAADRLSAQEGSTCWSGSGTSAGRTNLIPVNA